MRQAFPHITMRLIAWSITLFVATSLAVCAWDYDDRTALAKSGDSSPLASAWYELSYGGDYETALTALEPELETNGSELALQAYARLKSLTGDSDTAVEYYLKTLELYPQSPLAELYMYKALILLEDTNGYSSMVSTLKGLLDNPETPPYLRGRIAVYLNDLYRLRGDYEQADTMLTQYNPITDWQIIGPFDNEGKHGLDAVYGPENVVDLNGSYKGKEYEVSWRQLPYPSPNGFYELTPVMVPNRFGTVYLTTSVKSPGQKDIFLMAGASGASKIWLNGELILEENEYNTGLYDTYAIPVTLQAGDNLLLVKLCGDGGAWEIGQRFVALDGAPITDVSFDASSEAINRAKLTAPLPSHETTADFSARIYFDGLIADGSADPYVLTYAAIYHYLYRDYDETAEIPKRIMNLGRNADPEHLELLYYGGIYDSEPNVARANYEELLRRAPRNAAAAIELVKYYNVLDRPDKAYHYIDLALDINPEFVEALQYKAKYYWEEGRPYDARETALEILEHHPDYIYGKMIQGLYETDYGSLTEAERYYRAIYNLDRTQDFAHEKLYTLYKQENRYDDAIRLVEEITTANPYDGPSRRILGYDLNAVGKTEEALYWLDEALKVCPQDYQALAYKGIALEMAGRDAEAKTAYDTALKYKHNYPWLADYLDYRSPAEPTLDEKRRLDTYELIADYPGDDAFPDDNAVILLNDRIVEVYPNGTFSRAEHQVIKILSPEGAEKFRQVYVIYEPSRESVELRRMAVIKPNGDELTANQMYDSNIFDIGNRLYHSDIAKVIMMPNLAPGDYIDFEYSVKPTGPNLYADYFGDIFQFGDYNSTVKSRYILSVPSGRDFYFKTYRGIPAPMVERTGGNTIYTFEMSGLPNVTEESYMPPISEISPLLRVSTFRTWNEVAKWYTGLIRDVYAETAEADSLADELYNANLSNDEMISLVYNYVVKNVRYVGLEFGVNGYRPRSPRDVLQTSYGDCKDKATLMNTMMDNYGFKTYPVMIRTANLGETDYGLPMLGYFNHMISYVELPDGTGYFLDGTASFSGYDELPPNDQDIEVVVVDGERARFIRTPLNGFEKNSINTYTEFSINPDGSAEVERTVEYGAYASSVKRLDFESISQRRKNIEDFWSAFYPGTIISGDEYSGIDDMNQQVVISYEAQIPEAFKIGDDKIMLTSKLQPDYLVDSYARKASREHDLIIKDNRRYYSEMTYNFPEGYEVEVAPLEKELTSDFGYIKTTMVSEVNGVRVTIQVDVPAQTITPDEYSAFRQFCLEVDTWEDEPIILKKTN